MRRTVLVLGAVVLLLVLPPAPLLGEEEPPAFPASWEGVWKGTALLVRSFEGRTSRRAPGGGGGAETTFAMELHVARLERRPGWTWRIVYGEGAEQHTRPYEIRQAEGPRFLIDEGNDILLDAYFEHDVLHCRFRVVDTVIEATYAREGDVLTVTTTAFGAEARRVVTAGEGGPRIESYALQSVTRARLKRAR